MSLVAALAGGVGGAKFLTGLLRAVDPERVVGIVNTGDDDTFHGLHVSPDLDTVVYTLGRGSDPHQGWGLAGDTFRCLEALSRYGAPTWFRLGDSDFATHVFRTERLRAGATLSKVTREIGAAWGLTCRLLPMSDDPVSTRISIQGPDGPVELAMQEWFVRFASRPPVVSVRFAGADRARPAPGVLDALSEAEIIVLCPSNPVLSIGPILAVPGVREVLARRRHQVVAVSPIIRGSAVRGPADRVLAGLGIEVSCFGVAQLYAPVCQTLLVDTSDAEHIPAIESLGMRAVLAPLLMTDPASAEALARRTLDARPASSPAPA